MAVMSEFPQPDPRDIQRAAKLLKACTYGVVLTGAGISTPSGIPDFRSPGTGLWARYDPVEVASLASFRYHPEKFFSWLHILASNIASAQPNPAHIGIARLEKAGCIQTVITQ